MQTVKHKGKLLAFRLGMEDFGQGLSFFTRAEAFLQVGSWHYQAGQILNPHNHNIVPRSADRTQEAVVVLKGRIRADIYGEDDIFVASIEAGERQVLVLLQGGHGYEVLEDGTVAIEIKNGPYLGPDTDRRVIAV